MMLMPGASGGLVDGGGDGAFVGVGGSGTAVAVGGGVGVESLPRSSSQPAVKIRLNDTAKRRPTARSRTLVPHNLNDDLAMPRPDIEVEMYYLLPGAQR
jgi:hypothetical protein